MGWLIKPLCRVSVSALLLLAVWPSGMEAQFLSQQATEADGARLLRNPSPRLTGMGLLRIAVEDENNEVNLFDYVGSVAGLLADRDSTSIDFQFDFVRHRTDWRSVDPWSISPAGALYPNMLDFGGADLEERFGFERYDLLAAFRSPGDLAVGARVSRTSSFIGENATKYDITYIKAVGEEDDLVPDTLTVGQATRDSLSRVDHWVFDVMADKEVLPGFVVGGHAVFTLEERAPEVFHEPDSMVAEFTRVSVVDTEAMPHEAIRRYPYAGPEGESDGVGGGIAFSYEVYEYVTFGAAGDISSTDTKLALRGRFFRQEMTQDEFRKTGKLHSLVKLGRVLEGAIKYESASGDGSGEYFWSFGCPVQGGGFDWLTREGLTADKYFWEEKAGTRWLIRVPETSIKLSVEYEGRRGNTTLEPDPFYNADVFEVPGTCAPGGEDADEHPRQALVIDNLPVDLDFEEKTFAAGASLTLWFGRRPLSVATEYESWTHEWEEATEGPGTRDLSLLKLGSEVGVNRKITARVGAVWGEERVTRETVGSVYNRPLEGVWTEKTITLGGAYVLEPGLWHVEGAYTYTSREPDFEDVFTRETKDHRLTGYLRFYF